MLRESMHSEGREVALGGVATGFREGVDVPHAALLVDFAEAVVAAFHGFVRIADAIGIPYTTAAGGRDAPDVREQAGINEFYRVRSS